MNGFIFLTKILIGFASIFVLPLTTLGNTSSICEKQISIRTLGETRDKLSRLQFLFHLHQNTKGIQGFINIMSSNLLIPQGGTLYVVGPSSNFYEWAAPLLIRPDINIIVFEKDSLFLPIDSQSKELKYGFDYPEATDNFSTKEVDGIFNLINKYNPKLIEHSAIDSIAKFSEAIKDRVTFAGALRNLATNMSHLLIEMTIKEKGINSPLPNADLVILNQHNSTNSTQSLKNMLTNTGVIWASDDVGLPMDNVGFISKPLYETDVSIFLQPSYLGHDEEGRFRGFEHRPRSYLLAPNPNITLIQSP